MLVAGCLSALTLAAVACSSVSSVSSSQSATVGTQASPIASGSASSTVAAAKADIARYTQAVTSYPAQHPVTGASGLRGKTVWYIPIGESVPILATFGLSMQAALSHVGISMHTCDGKFLPTSGAACVSQAITQGASGVVTGYIDYASMPNAFNSLVAHHIPVLIAGEAPDGGKTSSTPQLAFISGQSTLDLSQKLLMDAVIADSGGKANILYLGVTDSPSTLTGANYGKAYLTSRCPGCTLNEITYNTASISKLPSQVSAGLIAHPDTSYVVDELDAAAPPSVQGIQAAGYAGKVRLASANGDLDCLQRISSKTIQFVDVGTSPIFSGWQFADGIIRMLLGHVPTSINGLIRVFTPTNVAGLTLSPAAYATNAWYGSDAFEQTFLTAWGVK
jgi:ribose transport system substrate-binding protein